MRYVVVVHYKVDHGYDRPGHSLFFSRFALCSPLIFIHGSLSLILPIFRFTHRSIAVKKPEVRSWKRALKRWIAPKTTAVCSYVCIVYDTVLVHMYIPNDSESEQCV